MKGKRVITLGNETKVEIKVVGTMCLILDVDFVMDLINTICVNLIAIPRLDSYGYELKFGNRGVCLFLFG